MGICCDTIVCELQDMHLPIVICCGTERALFANTLLVTLPVYKVLCMYAFRLSSYRNIHIYPILMYGPKCKKGGV